MATNLRRFGRLVLVPRCKTNNCKGFSSSSSDGVGYNSSSYVQQQHNNVVKSMNLFSAINQALHIALETDPRFVSISFS